MSLRRSSSSAKDEKGEKKEDAKCGTCDKVCKVSDKVLLCRGCNRHFHSVCQKVEDAKYQVINSDSVSENPCIFWYCNSSCKMFAAQFINSMTDFKKSLAGLRDDVDQVKSKVSKIDSKISDIDKGRFSEAHSDQVRYLARDEVECVMAERLNEEVKELNMEEKFEEAVSAAVREVNERQSRKKSLIIHGVPMCKSKELKARVDFDKKYLESVIKDGLEINDKVTARKITRLGKKDDKKRPMKVQLDNPMQARQILQAVKSISLQDKDKFKDINIVSDRTPLERAEWKKLVKLREERQAMSDAQNDGVKWVIAGNRVVKERAQDHSNDIEGNETHKEDLQERSLQWK